MATRRPRRRTPKSVPLKHPIPIMGGMLRSVRVLPPEIGVLDDWRGGGLRGTAVPAALLGLADNEFRRLRWDDVERLLNKLVPLLPADLQQALTEPPPGTDEPDEDTANAVALAKQAHDVMAEHGAANPSDFIMTPEEAAALARTPIVAPQEAMTAGPEGLAGPGSKQEARSAESATGKQTKGEEGPEGLTGTQEAHPFADRAGAGFELIDEPDQDDAA